MLANEVNPQAAYYLSSLANTSNCKMWWSETAQRHEVPTAVLWNLAAIRRRTVTVCYVPLISAADDQNLYFFLLF